MINDVKLMGIRELQQLIRKPASGNVAIGDFLKCIPVVDVFLEVEQIRKHKPGSNAHTMLKEQGCEFHEAYNKGYVQIAPLDITALQNGLFEVGDDFSSAQFWYEVIRTDVDPAYSARLISLRSYDKNCGTQFCTEVVS